MATQLHLQSLKIHPLNFSISNQNYLKNPLDPHLRTASLSMWNPNQARQEDEDDDDDSWEVRAFAEDAGNVLGTTWPPRSYTCTFCRREFRSAQALGGHMNVHRRDRLRFHHQFQANSIKPISSSTSSSLPIPPHEIVGGSGGAVADGVCYFYQLSNPNSNFLNPTTSPASILSISPSMTPLLQAINSPVEQRGTSSSSSHCSQISSKGDESFISMDDGNEKLDLELRLGHRP